MKKFQTRECRDRRRRKDIKTPTNAGLVFFILFYYILFLVGNRLEEKDASAHALASAAYSNEIIVTTQFSGSVWWAPT